MTLITTPRQLAARAELYYQLHQLQAAGIGLIEALQAQYRSPPHPSHRQPLGHIINALKEGNSLSESLPRTGKWLPQFDAALLAAGEKSGRLPDSFRLLADVYRNQSTLLRDLLSSLTYPLFLIHFAALSFPLPNLVLTGNLFPYLKAVAVILIPIYTIAFAFAYATQSTRGESWRSTLETLTNSIPILGPARRNLALARLCAALEALVSAGVPLIQGWELAAAASGSPSLRRAVAKFKPQLEAGQTPADVVARSSAFPELFANMYQTGEISGQLDDTLKRLHDLHQAEGSRQLQSLATWTPKIIYLGIVVFIAYSVISFYKDYFNRALEGL